jgi:hypothetical protein
MANRYWVGGTGTWDATAGTKWAATSGGAGGQSVPSSIDDVFLDAASGAVTITLSGASAKSLTCTGFTGTLGSGGITVYGNVTLVAGMTVTSPGTLSVNASTATIISAGKTLGNLTLSSVGGAATITLGDDLTCTGTTTLSNGTLSLAGFNLSTGTFSASGTSGRSVAFGTGNISLTNTTPGTTVLSAANATGLTFTGTGGFLRNQAATATIALGSTSFSGNVNDLPNFTVTGGSSDLTITSGSHFKAVDLSGGTGTATGAVSIYGSLTLGSGISYSSLSPTFRVTGTVTSNGSTLGNTEITNGNGGTFEPVATITLADNLTIGSTGTFTLTRGVLALAGFTLSTGTFLSNNSNTRSIAFGSGNIALTSSSFGAIVLDMANANGLTCTGTGGFTRNQGSSATVRCNGAPADCPNLFVNAGSSNLSITATSTFRSIDFTGNTSTVTGGVLVHNAITFASGGTYTGLSVGCSGTQTINSNGKTLGNFTVAGSGITVTLGANLTVIETGATTLTQGTLNLGGFALSTGTFISNNSNTRTLVLGSQDITLTRVLGPTTVLSIAIATGFAWSGTGGFVYSGSATHTFVVGTTGGTVARAVNLTILSGSVINISAGSWFKNVDLTGLAGNWSATTFNVTGNLTFGVNTLTTSTSAPTFLGTGTLTSNGKTISSLTVNGAGITVTCADAVSVTNALTFSQGTLKLKSGETSTVGSFVTSGTTLKYLQSTTPGSQAAISDTTGTNTATYLSIQDSSAVGGAVWDATSPTNFNAGNNTGWLGFGGTNMFLVF